jgi:hypothetical protein
MLALVGRQAARRITTLSLLGLAIGSVSSGLAVFWLLAVLTLLRDPPRPCEEEIKVLTPGMVAIVAACIAVPMLVLLPFPYAQPPELVPF